MSCFFSPIKTIPQFLSLTAPTHLSRICRGHTHQLSILKNLFCAVTAASGGNATESVPNKQQSHPIATAGWQVLHSRHPTSISVSAFALAAKVRTFCADFNRKMRHGDIESWPTLSAFKTGNGYDYCRPVTAICSS